jgi:hypothetical protein
MEQETTVATYNDPEPAERLAARLRDEGIAATVYDESNEQKWKLFNLRPRAHLRVRVPGASEAATQTLLAAWKGEELLLQAVHCPECSSSRVEFPQFSRRTIMGALPAALAATGVIEQEFYCENCHFTWPAEPAKPEAELDILNWPKGRTF